MCSGVVPWPPKRAAVTGQKPTVGAGEGLRPELGPPSVPPRCPAEDPAAPAGEVAVRSHVTEEGPTAMARCSPFWSPSWAAARFPAGCRLHSVTEQHA